MARLTPWLRVSLALFAVGWGANQFASMLLAYGHELGMSTQTRALLFGLYAVGLIPALLVGGAASDRWGRRAVVLPFVALSPVASVALIVWSDWTPGLAAARLLAGLSSGIVFGAATAWVADLSADERPGTGARRAGQFLTAGFAVGPLTAGLIAEFSDHPLTVPYVPHLVLGVLSLVLLWPVAGPRPAVPSRRPLFRLPAVALSRQFVLTVAPAAPWVFASAVITFAYLPSVIDTPVEGELAFAALLTFVTLGTGVAVQPLARRLDDRRIGMLLTIAALLLGVLAVGTDNRWVVLLAAPVFGAGYGFGLVSGLRAAERLAPDSERGALVGVFYSLAYLGMFAPYLLGAFGSAQVALLTAIGVAVASLAVISTTGSNRPVRG